VFIAQVNGDETKEVLDEWAGTEERFIFGTQIFKNAEKVRAERKFKKFSFSLKSSLLSVYFKNEQLMDCTVPWPNRTY